MYCTYKINDKQKSSSYNSVCDLQHNITARDRHLPPQDHREHHRKRLLQQQ